ncbi:MAG: cobalamin B12-binding domain-containing protein [Sciscionella sp.]
MAESGLTARVTTDPPSVRCLLAMLGVDIHSKGLRALARTLRDRGIEVIYLGEHNTAQGLVNAIMAEDPDVVGLSFSTTTYRDQVAALFDAMRAAGIADVPVMIGGLIHPEDEADLRAMGVAAIFGPGSTTEQILDFLAGVAA